MALGDPSRRSLRENFLLLALAAGLAILSCTGCQEKAGPAAGTGRPVAGAGQGTVGYRQGDTMPDFTVSTLDGGSFKLSAYAGKVVFINLFVTWCQPCCAEMPAIQKLYAAYGDKVQFIAIDVGKEKKETIAKFARDKNYTIPMAYSPDGSFGNYKVEFIPQTFVLDPQGVIMYYCPGAADYQTFSGEISKLNLSGLMK